MSNLPDSTSLSGLCTRCGKPDSTFDVDERVFLAEKEYEVLEPGGGKTRPPGERVTVLICQDCQGRVAVIERFGRRFDPEPDPPASDEIDEKLAKITPQPQNTQVVWHGVQWWPPTW